MNCMKCSDIQTHALTLSLKNESNKKQKKRENRIPNQIVATLVYYIFGSNEFISLYLVGVGSPVFVVACNFGMCYTCHDSIYYSSVSITRPGDDSYFLLLYFRSINIVISISIAILVLFFVLFPSFIPLDSCKSMELSVFWFVSVCLCGYFVDCCYNPNIFRYFLRIICFRCLFNLMFLRSCSTLTFNNNNRFYSHWKNVEKLSLYQCIPSSSFAVIKSTQCKQWRSNSIARKLFLFKNRWTNTRRFSLPSVFGGI